MAVCRRTFECYPGDAGFEDLLVAMGYSPREPEEPQHEKCKGSESYPGVIDGWFCPCPCHRKIDPELKETPPWD